jgi:uncharacterized membrane protein/thiol-disulfide isomerase/thioredoxin
MRKTSPSLLRLFALILLVSAVLSGSLAAPVQAAEPVVHAVLFFSPSCGHCHKVMTEDLPPLKEKYGAQLDILEVNTQTDEGRLLFYAALEKYEITQAGVPLMVVGETVMMGSREIPELLPGLIEAGLTQGGVAWPEIEGLEDYLDPTAAQADPPANTVALPAVQSSGGSEEAMPATPVSDDQELTLTGRWMNNFKNDLVGNSVAVVTLLGMVLTVGMIGYTFVTTDEETPPRGLAALRWPAWIIPLLCVLGIGVASYLSYVEIYGVKAVCGPVGNCNAVQESVYAKLWGILPVGILGLVGYLGILGGWFVHRSAKTASLRKLSAAAMWGMALVGVLFSIYLTFLEPFVIGATCAWCITSALIITLLLVATTRPALEALEG